jgi:hypothetical protein
MSARLSKSCRASRSLSPLSSTHPTVPSRRKSGFLVVTRICALLLCGKKLRKSSSGLSALSMMSNHCSSSCESQCLPALSVDSSPPIFPMSAKESFTVLTDVARIVKTAQYLQSLQLASRRILDWPINITAPCSLLQTENKIRSSQTLPYRRQQTSFVGEKMQFPLLSFPKIELAPGS